MFHIPTNAAPQFPLVRNYRNMNTNEQSCYVDEAGATKCLWNVKQNWVNSDCVSHLLALDFGDDLCSDYQNINKK